MGREYLAIMGLLYCAPYCGECTLDLHHNYRITQLIKGKLFEEIRMAKIRVWRKCNNFSKDSRFWHTQFILYRIKDIDCGYKRLKESVWRVKRSSIPGIVYPHGGMLPEIAKLHINRFATSATIKLTINAINCRIVLGAYHKTEKSSLTRFFNYVKDGNAFALRP